MKIIDLFVKIANGELKEGFNFYYHRFNWKYDELSNKILRSGDNIDFMDWLGLNTLNCLNDEVEILDEPNKIEKIDMCTSGIMGFDGVEHITEVLKNKLNEVIDKVNSLDKEDKNE